MQPIRAIPTAFADCALALGLWSERGERTVDARLRLAEELLVFSREHGFPFWVALGAIQRGWCLSMAGREAEGVAQLTGGLAALRSTGTAVPLPYGFTLLAEACGRARRLAAGVMRSVQCQAGWIRKLLSTVLASRRPDANVSFSSGNCRVTRDPFVPLLKRLWRPGVTICLRLRYTMVEI